MHGDELLESAHNLDIPANYAACLNANGLYNSMQFVLRLSPRVHELIDSVPNGIHRASDLTAEQVRAFSTYLHETVHWWQHVGSSAGFIQSLCYPAQAYSNLKFIREYIESVGPKKPIRKWVHDAQLSGSENAPAIAAGNTVINNLFDIDFFKIFSISPDRAEELYDHQYFECVGHASYIAYTHVVSLLADTCDRDWGALPNPARWEEPFSKLTQQKVEGFYYGSPIRRARLGAHAIFEGQARFIQLQYLAFHSFDWTMQDIGERGLLDGIYVVAFNRFLALTSLSYPARIDDPIIGLFLVVCDLAINPSAGFPFQISEFSEFILDTDPGIRFERLCLAAKGLDAKDFIQTYTREEYVTISQELSQRCGFDSPIKMLTAIAQWPEKSLGIAAVMEEQKTFNYAAENLPVRLLFSHYIAFAKAKLERPDFYCWAGAWMTGEKASVEIQNLFLNHLSLFADRPDKPGVYPRIIPGKDGKLIKQTFDIFYGNNIIYDLTRQLIAQDGPFKFEFDWLAESHMHAPLQQWADEVMKKVYGRGWSDFRIL